MGHQVTHRRDQGAGLLDHHLRPELLVEPTQPVHLLLEPGHGDNVDDRRLVQHQFEPLGRGHRQRRRRRIREPEFIGGPSEQVAEKLPVVPGLALAALPVRHHLLQARPADAQRRPARLGQTQQTSRELVLCPALGLTRSPQR
ncbi:hypothetical protein [Pseudonocardia sp. Ae717_Ps2]|uniref:hypothetical protein n=1 Tax=Pseudonocardia sp. Ae717_Ps2 TaxID=1885573 RepID=UPI0011872CB0|nr:hypothetical protein [Pseudonocardia sp. Ae717_Ps2]